MDSENKKSDSEEILSEFQKTHVDEPAEEPQAEAEPQAENESHPTHEPQNTIEIQLESKLSDVSATLI